LSRVSCSPSAKKVIQTSEKQIGDMARKIADSRKSAKDMRKAFHDACAAIGIEVTRVYCDPQCA